MLTKATVVGTGAMGTVLAQVLAGNNIHVALLGRRSVQVESLLTTRENRRYLPGIMLSERIMPTADPAKAMANSELVVSAVPCQFLRATWERIGSYVGVGVPICSVTKGIETETLARPSQIIDAYVGDNPIAVLSGPSIAPELARCLPATVVVACASAEVARLVQGVLSTSAFRVYTNPDVPGVELAGALKNVIALAAGILDGLRAGDNAKAALLTRGLVEITRLAARLGARQQTFVGLAGVGDLVTTCVSPLGRNRSAGERIGRGTTVESVVRESPAVIEGIPTTRAVLALAARYNVEMPITEAVNAVLFEKKPPLDAITELMNRPPKAEEPL
ncbi:MAG: NAD(P)H-dependent glycerol-3-phosphate dehydrogenase [Phycisphaerae bacterium]